MKEEQGEQDQGRANRQMSCRAKGEPVNNYMNLVAWQKAHELALRIYKATDSFPRKEIYGLTNQLRRAALSVPANIVEGYNRSSKRELLRFLDIALGSLAEVEYLIAFSNDIGYLKKEEASSLRNLGEEVDRILRGLQRSKRKI
jgi:four helix bundle protein